MTRWADKYMGIPFKDGGRTMRGADCFGLYALILAREAGITIGDHPLSYGLDAEATVQKIAAEIASGPWITVVRGDGRAAKAVARRFDGILMTGHMTVGGRVIRGEVHMGCALGDGRVLHTEPGTGPQIVALDDPRIVKRVTGVYRHAALAGECAA